jgi:hypothetical protein
VGGEVAGGPPRPWEAIGRWAGPEARSRDEEEDRCGGHGVGRGREPRRKKMLQGSHAPARRVA